MLLYDSKFAKFPGKFCMHWLGPYHVKYVTNGGAVKLAKLNNEEIPTLMIESRIKLYIDNPPTQMILFYKRRTVQMLEVVERDIALETVYLCIL